MATHRSYSALKTEMISNYAERITTLEQQLAEAQRKLLALRWRPITPENLPTSKDEVEGWQDNSPEIAS